MTETLADNSISAYTGKDRPAWRAVLEHVESGSVDVVIAWHIDRMTRSMLDLEQLILLAKRQGVGIATATGDIDLTTDVGRMVARILAAVARAEVERKAARQRLANTQRAHEGKPSTGGARPFGYDRTHMHIVEAEAAAIREGAIQTLAGQSLASIARQWDAAGLVSSRASESKTGKGWTSRGVRGVLLSPRYAGIRSYKGEDIGEGTWPAILDLETHLALKARLLNPARRMGASAKGRTAENLLTGIARCAVCDKTVTASKDRTRLVYKCRPSGHVNTPREVADVKAMRDVLLRLSMPDKRVTLVSSEDTESATAKAEEVELLARLDGLAEAFAEGVITRAQLEAGTAKVRARLAELEQVLAQAGEAASALTALRSLTDESSTGETYRTMRQIEHQLGRLSLDELKRRWQGLSLERQRALVDMLCTVTLHPGSADADAVEIAWKPA